MDGYCLAYFVLEFMMVPQKGLLVIWSESFPGFESLSIISMQLKVAKSHPMSRPQLISSA